MAPLGNGDIGLVPTMGAFHEGHSMLMAEARKRHGLACVSIFVNPLQFGQGEDFERYPRDEERDFAIAEEQGMDYVFAPSATEIYPRQSTIIHVPQITELWEGSFRPGHFDGVATVVAKLFQIVRPRTAYFGWKDLQQCLVIRRMVEDLNFNLELEYLETMRAADGLALSSRNAYLSPEERKVASLLKRTLDNIADSIRTNTPSIDATLTQSTQDLTHAGFAVDYLEVVSLRDMQPLRAPGEGAIIVAAKLGATRLIDNLRITIREP